VKGEQFIAEVKNLAELDSDEDAQKTVRATLETLRERLAGNEPADLAAQLPPEIAPFVEGAGEREAFSVQEFYERVAHKEGTKSEEAVKHARAVATVVQTAVTGGALEDVRSQLGNDYEELFGQTGSSAYRDSATTKEDAMPYKQITQLPDNVKNNLPKHAQEIYKEAFDSAEDQYGEEDRAHRVAWSAVENKYEKNDKGNWVKKDS
jgi:cation transport regulator